MHSAIVVVEMPEAPHDATDSPIWMGFLANVDRAQTSKPEPLHKKKGVERLGENVWLVDFSANPEPLARLVIAAGEHKLAYKILPLADAPRWLPDASDPKTK